ncbi:MAG: hypothetical protein ABJD97_04420 [Betaproteobacteria bacterium]
MTVALTNTLMTVGIVALVAWRLYSRIRRAIGRQRLSPLRPWLTVTLFPLLVALLLLGSMATAGADPLVAPGLAAGVLAGVALGLYGTRLTRFEATPAGLFYTPNAHLGIALSLLLVLRIGYRVLTIYLSGQALDAQSLQMHSSPLTLAIFGTLAGYYVTYAIGLLRWRRSVRRQA